MKCPCRGCTERWVSKTSRCHASCKKYKDWVEYVREQNGIIVKQQSKAESIGKVLYGHRRKS